MQRKVLLWPVVLLLFCLSGVLLASGQNASSENKGKRPVAAKKAETPKKGSDSRPDSTAAIDSDLVKAAPLQGRSLQSLLNMLPGVVRTFEPYDKAGQFSVNGLRTDANYWTVDGVSANVGISLTRSPSTDQTLTGAVPEHPARTQVQLGT